MIETDEWPTYNELRTGGAPPGTAWGVFGPADQLGTLNFVTNTMRAEATRLVRRGAVFNLDHPIGAFDPYPSGTRPPTRHEIFSTNPNHRDDWLDSFYLQSTSQIDGLRHIRHPRHGFYGGTPDDRVKVGTPDLGIQVWADHGIVGRGVLLDMVRHFEFMGDPINYQQPRYIDQSDLDDCAQRQGVQIKPGDMVLLHTGWASWYLEQRATANAVPGFSVGLNQSHGVAGWLWDHRIALAAADNVALEAWPTSADSDFWDADEPAPESGANHNGMLHRILIAGFGLAVGEMWSLRGLADDCAEDGQYEFLLVAKPLAVVGGVGSPPNAVAIK